jgi:hypothetical protein
VLPERVKALMKVSGLELAKVVVLLKQQRRHLKLCFHLL